MANSYYVKREKLLEILKKKLHKEQIEYVKELIGNSQTLLLQRWLKGYFVVCIPSPSNPTRWYSPGDARRFVGEEEVEFFADATKNSHMAKQGIYIKFSENELKEMDPEIHWVHKVAGSLTWV